MDLHDHRVAAVGLEARRRRNPGLDRAAIVAAGHLDLLDRREVDVRQRVFVQGRQAACIAVTSHDRQVGRSVRSLLRVHDGSTPRPIDTERTGRVRATEAGAADVRCESLDLAGQADGNQRRLSEVLDECVDPATVRAEHGVAHGMVEVRGEIAHVGSVAVHQVQLRLLVAPQGIVEAGICDERAVGRHGRRAVGTIPSGQCRAIGGRHVDGVDLALDRVQLGVGGIVADRQHRVGIQPARRPEVALAVGDLPGFATIGRHDEHVPRALSQPPLAVEAEREIVEDTYGGCPVGALRRFRGFGEFRRFLGREHDEGQALPIRRPGHRGRRLQELRQREIGPVVQEKHPELGPVAVRCPIGDAVAGRRPARRRDVAIGDQRPVRTRLEIHHPQLSEGPVPPLVVGTAHVDDRFAIGCHLRFGGPFEGEDILGGEEPGLVRAKGRTGERQAGGGRPKADERNSVHLTGRLVVAFGAPSLRIERRFGYAGWTGRVIGRPRQRRSA